MADQKISELTALTGANLADVDAFAVVDTSAVQTKKITYAELKTALDTGTGFVRITGDTMTGALNVQSTITSDGLTVDAANSTFNGAVGITSAAGAGISEGLLIDYSTNLARFLTYDSTTGSEIAMYTQPSGGSTAQRLRINSGGDISFYENTGSTPKLQWSASNERLFLSGSDYQFGIGQGSNQPWYSRAVSDGSFRLHLNGTGDIITADSTGNLGIGTASPQALIDLTVSQAKTVTSGATFAMLGKTNESSGYAALQCEIKGGASASARNWEFQTVEQGVANAGNIIFQKDGGNVGIGTGTIANEADHKKLKISGGSGTGAGMIEFADTSNNIDGAIFADGGNLFIVADRDNATADSSIRFRVDGSSEKMRIDSSGRVGIGGVANANWRNDATDTVLQLGTEATLHSDGNVTTELWNNAYVNNSDQYKNISTRGASRYMQYEGNHRFFTAASASAGSTISMSERMRIDSSGRVGIGTTAPAQLLEVSGNGGKSRFTRSGSSGTAMEFYFGGTQAGGIQVQGTGLGISGAARENDLFIDSSGNVGIGSTRTDRGLLNINHDNTGDAFNSSHIALTYDVSPTDNNSKAGITYATSDSDNYGYFQGAERTTSGQGAFVLRYHNNSASGTERMRIDSSGNVLVGTTSNSVYNDSSGTGIALNTGQIQIAGTGTPLYVNRQGSDGDLVDFRKDGASVGSIGTTSGFLTIGGTTANHGGLRFDIHAVLPMEAGTQSDNTIDLGNGSYRYDDVYATNGTIQTSDQTEKQDIAALTSTEMLVGKRISALFKTFRWKDKVASKGDNARTHTGIIAQDVQAAFTAEGLDAGDYSLFISSTWLVDSEGNEVEEGTEDAVSKTRMGIRYPELLSFVAAYNEQRFANIETRLTTLEG